MMVSKQDIVTAIKNPSVFLKIPELQGASVKLNPNGAPFSFVGGFNMVFQILQNGKKWAFRVWHVTMGKNKERYQKISNYLSSKRLRYFADFIYDEKGLLVNGELLDTIRMEWLDGLLLKDYIGKNLRNKNTLINLAAEFLQMSTDLRANKISHGDLQEGNILVDNQGQIRLIDYDSICVPGLEDQIDLVTGLKGYQHPSRFKGGKASLKSDYFSELIIYLSIIALAEKPELWDKYQVKDTQYLLFTENDLTVDLESSQIYRDLYKLTPEIDRLLKVLSVYLNENDFKKLNPFEEYLHPPIIIEFKSNKEVVMQGVEVVFNWKINNAVSAKIFPEIGDVNTTGKIRFKPIHNKFTLHATGYFEDVATSIEIKVFPTPVIESIFLPAPILQINTAVTLKNPNPIKLKSYNTLPLVNFGITMNAPNIRFEVPHFVFNAPLFIPIKYNSVFNTKGNFLSSLITKFEKIIRRKSKARNQL